MQPRPQPVEALRETFLRARRVVVEDLLERADVEALAAEVRALPFVAVRNAAYWRRRREQPVFSHQHFIVEATTASSPLRALVRSFASGPLRDLVQTLTARQGLHNELGGPETPILVAHAYPRGGHLGAHDDAAIDDGSRRSIALVLHLSPTWDRTSGGLLRFLAPPIEEVVPRFGALHLFEVGPHNRHEVTRVTGRDVRYTVSGWLYER